MTTTFDTITFEFDRALVMGLSFVHATLDGQEVYGELSTGDFANTLVFDVTSLPFRPAAYQPHDLRISVLATAEDGATRWFERRLTYVKLDIGPGDAGEAVRDLQTRLHSLGYWIGTLDGNYGTLTIQAVMAFQKYHGLARTGQVDTQTRDLLAVATRPVPRSTGSGRLIEIDKTRQVLMVVQDGQVLWAFNTSTGTETEYVHEGRRGFAHTPEGHFTLFRQIDGPRESHLGWMWRPKYFTSDGVAIHGSSSVPAYPASHGCVRVTNPAMDFVWSANLAPLGTPVWVYV
jgi:putative peptidoglycan binding protein/L,D-transpeptidase-like protein